jgi:hypothetical protein
MVEALLIAVMRTRGLLMAAGVLLGALVGATGCRHADLAEQRLAMRCERVARTVDTARKRESHRPRRLARTLNEIDRSVRRHARASRVNADEIERYWQRDAQRWLKRQSLYRREAGRVLRGKPDRIERNVIILFF